MAMHCRRCLALTVLGIVTTGHLARSDLLFKEVESLTCGRGPLVRYLRGLRDTDVVKMPCPRFTMQLKLGHKKNVTDDNSVMQVYTVDDCKPQFAWSKSRMRIVQPYRVGEYHPTPSPTAGYTDLDMFLDVEITKDDNGFHNVEADDFLSFSSTIPWSQDVRSLGIPLRISYTREDIVPILPGLREDERDTLIVHFQTEKTSLFHMDVEDVRDIVTEVFRNVSTTARSRITRSLKAALGVPSLSNEL
jgi:hypothetical protein